MEIIQIYELLIMTEQSSFVFFYPMDAQLFNMEPIHVEWLMIESVMCNIMVKHFSVLSIFCGICNEITHKICPIAHP